MERLHKFTFFYLEIVLPISILIPLAPAIGRYKQLPTELKIFCWYLFISAITNVLTSVLASYALNNMPVMHVYTVFEFGILSVFYKKILNDLDIIINALIFAFILFCFFNVFFLQDIFSYNSYAKSLEAITIILFAIMYFKKSLDTKGLFQNIESSITYINSALLLYFSGSFILFIIQNVTVTSIKLGLFIWSIHGTLLLAMYILIAIGLWQYKKSELPALNNQL